MEDLREDLSELEQRFGIHDAVCGERYREILKGLSDGQHQNSTTQRIMLVGFAVLAIALMLGPHDGLLAMFQHLVGK